MICYKGNSFFRIFKILIKDFVEKVKLSFMKRFTNFKRHMSKKNLFFVQIKKFFVQKNKKRRHVFSQVSRKFSLKIKACSFRQQNTLCITLHSYQSV